MSCFGELSLEELSDISNGEWRSDDDDGDSVM